MVTIETSKESSELTQIQDIKDASKVDLSWVETVVDQVETWWKKWKEKAIQHIKEWEVRAVVNYLDNYEGLDSDVLMLILKKWNDKEKDTAASNMKNFLWNDKYINNDIAFLLISSWRWNYVAKYIEIFDENIHNNIAHKLINYPQKLINNEDWTKTVTREAKELYAFFNNFSKFRGLDKNIANKILKLVFRNKNHDYIDWIKFIAENLKCFTKLDKKFVDLLIKKWYLKEVINNNAIFEWLDYKYFVEIWKIKEIIENIDKFEGIDQVELIKKYIDLGEDIEVLYKNRHKFNEEWKEYFKNYMIERKYLRDTDWTLKSFKWLNSDEFIEKMSETKILNEIREHWPDEHYHRGWNKNFLFTTTTRYPTYFSWATDFGLPLTIHHIKWKILDIKINDLDIEFNDLNDAFYVTGIISQAAKQISKEDSIYTKCLINRYKDLELQDKNNKHGSTIYIEWRNKLIDKNLNKIVDYINQKWWKEEK